MKTVFAKSFFESNTVIDSIKSKWYQFKQWFKYHFDRNSMNLMKTTWNGRPYDYSYLYELEQAKLKEMIDYHKKHRRYIGVDIDIKRMELCVKLIDIFLENKNLFHYTGDMKFIPTSDGYELNMDGCQYHCDVYVNTKNKNRFVKEPHCSEWVEKQPHELYILKAKHLYHLIREQDDFKWWD